jgi:hypothetical protein
MLRKHSQKFYLISIERYIKCKLHKRYFFWIHKRVSFISIRETIFLTNFQCGMLVKE